MILCEKCYKPCFICAQYFFRFRERSCCCVGHCRLSSAKRNRKFAKSTDSSKSFDCFSFLPHLPCSLSQLLTLAYSHYAVPLSATLLPTYSLCSPRAASKHFINLSLRDSPTSQYDLSTSSSLTLPTWIRLKGRSGRSRGQDEMGRSWLVIKSIRRREQDGCTGYRCWRLLVSILDLIHEKLS